jgi:hypothetical protein
MLRADGTSGLSFIARGEASRSGNEAERCNCGCYSPHYAPLFHAGASDDHPGALRADKFAGAAASSGRSIKIHCRKADIEPQKTAVS